MVKGETIAARNGLALMERSQRARHPPKTRRRRCCVKSERLCEAEGTVLLPLQVKKLRHKACMSFAEAHQLGAWPAAQPAHLQAGVRVYGQDGEQPVFLSSFLSAE